MALLTSCGLQRQVNELKNRQAQSEIDSKNRDEAILKHIYGLLLNIGDVRTQLSNIDAAMLATNLTLMTVTEEQRASILALQAQQATLMVQVATLQGHTNIVSIVNPCGVQAANEEVFLKLSNGGMLASFSDTASGTNTRFALLSDGNFRTTDGTNCNFTMSNGGTVISNEHN